MQEITLLCFSCQFIKLLKFSKNYGSKAPNLVRKPRKLSEKKGHCHYQGASVAWGNVHRSIRMFVAQGRLWYLRSSEVCEPVRASHNRDKDVSVLLNVLKYN